MNLFWYFGKIKMVKKMKNDMLINDVIKNLDTLILELDNYYFMNNLKK